MIRLMNIQMQQKKIKNNEMREKNNNLFFMD